MPTYKITIHDFMGGAELSLYSGYEWFLDFNWRFSQAYYYSTDPPKKAPKDVPPSAKTNRFMVNNKREIPSVKVFKNL